MTTPQEANAALDAMFGTSKGAAGAGKDVDGDWVERHGGGEPSTPAALFGAAIDAAMEKDRLWFEAHPDRHFRLRPLLSREFNAPPATFSKLKLGRADGWWVVVAQAEPGVRFKVPFVMRAPLHAAASASPDRPDELPDEFLAHGFYRLAPGNAITAFERAKVRAQGASRE